MVSRSEGVGYLQGLPYIESVTVFDIVHRARYYAGWIR
jgi:hypothetical protein